MNIINNSQSTINYYRNITQANSEYDTDSEVKSREDTNKKQYRDSIELSSEAVNNPFANVLDNLVEAGTITEDQEYAIQSALQNGKSMQASGVYTNKRVDPLDSLVASGTITSDQASAVKNAFTAAGKPDKSCQTDPISSTLDDMVAAGTITQDQETAIENALASAMQAPPPPPKEGENPMDSTLDSLVAAGTITFDQSEAIKSALEKSKQTHHSEQNSNSMEAFMEDLSSTGLLTEDQITELQNTFSSMPQEV